MWSEAVLTLWNLKIFLNGKLFQKSKPKCKNKNFSQANVVDYDHADMFSSLNDHFGKKYRHFLVRVNKKGNISCHYTTWRKKKEISFLKVTLKEYEPKHTKHSLFS